MLYLLPLPLCALLRAEGIDTAVAVAAAAVGAGPVDAAVLSNDLG